MLAHGPARIQLQDESTRLAESNSLANISIYAIGPSSTVGDLRYGQEE